MGASSRQNKRVAVEVAVCRPADFPAVERIAKEQFALNAFSVDGHLPRPLYGELFFESIVQRAMEQSGAPLLTARADGQVAGFIVYAVDRNLGSVCGVPLGSVLLFGVDPQYRGRGVARALLQRVLQQLADDGMRLVTVGTDADNLPALQLYQDHGFRSRLNWTTWRWYPGFGIGLHLHPEAAGIQIRPFAGEPAALKAVQYIERPLAVLRDSTVPASGKVQLMAQLRRRAAEKLASGEMQALVAWDQSRLRSRPAGILIWNREERVERLYAGQGRMFRIQDFAVEPGYRGRGLGRALLQSLTARAGNCLFAEAWAAADDWPATNALAAAGFRPVHTATVLHCDLARRPAD